MRVSAIEVKEIMDNCTVGDTVIDTFIVAAEEMINRVFAGTLLSDTLLKEIERWLTAHMVASTLARMTSEEKLGDASVVYTGKWGEGLKSTPYGQMVLTLDPLGLLANAGKMSASIFAVNEFDE